MRFMIEILSVQSLVVFEADVYDPHTICDIRAFVKSDGFNSILFVGFAACTMRTLVRDSFLDIVDDIKHCVSPCHDVILPFLLLGDNLAFRELLVAPTVLHFSLLVH